MTRMLLPLIVVASTLLSAAPSPSQRAAATVTIGGRVTEAGTGRPVRRVLVTVTTSTALTESVATDADGRYIVTGLPPGRFQITAQRVGYLNGAHGAADVGRPAVPVVIAAGVSRMDLDIVMHRAGVITGTVTGAQGEPMEGLTVGAFRVPPDGRDVVMTQVAEVLTDDRGVYRMFGLPPGDYLVVAMAGPMQAASRTGELVTEEEIDRRLKVLASPGTLSTPIRDAAVRESSQHGLAPVYFPSVLSSADATPVRVRPGDDINGVDIQMRLTRLVTIDGIVHGDDAALSSMAIFFNSPGRRLPPLHGLVPRYTSRTVPGGREFTYTGVPPGTYTITAATRNATPENGVWGQIILNVTNHDIRGLSIPLSPMLTLHGRLTVSDDDPEPPAWTGASVRLATSNGIGQASTNGTLMGGVVIPPAQVQADGSFVIHGIVPASYTITVASPATTGLSVQALFVAGRDVFGRPLDIGSNLRDVVVQMTRRPTQLSGRIATADGVPGAAMHVVAFTVDRSAWGVSSRKVTSTRADTDGRWTLSALPPGNYHVVVLTDLAPGELENVQFLEQLTPMSITVSLAPGERKTQDLLIRGVSRF